ncbi:substrate-binding domain-containing protein [Bifidobacterium cebidarum]|nr:substrate-binding domain-containing protein [Bifidobacterium cebidarum]
MGHTEGEAIPVSLCCIVTASKQAPITTKSKEKSAIMKKRLAATLTAIIAMTFALTGCSAVSNSNAQQSGSENVTQTYKGAGKQASELKFATIVKSMGFNWFKRMETGVKQFASDTGIDAFEQGPSQADPAQENQVAQDALAQGVHALIIDPIDVAQTESVIKQAKQQGVVVVTLESPADKNAVYDVEAFDNKAYGRHIMDELAKSMDETGQYGIFVGALNSQSQMEWTKEAVSYQKEKYPNMEWVGDYNVTNSSQQTSYAQMNQLMKKYPDLKGALGADAFDVVGIGQAVQEAGKSGQIAVMGTSIVSYSGDLLKSGAITKIFTWDPADHGYVGNKVAQMVLEGKDITDGTDLGVSGYDNVTLKGNTIYGNGWIDITADNMDKYNF